MARNLQYGHPIEPVAVPSREHFETISQYEPTQIHRTYEYWAEDIVRRETQKRERHVNSVNLICKVAIEAEEDIIRTEQLENFIQWVGPIS